jgi:hypothetical protein
LPLFIVVEVGGDPNDLGWSKTLASEPPPDWPS